jgi:two-component system chemotaxis response regulator CheB
LLAVKTRGGIAVVQDPTEAIVESMPRNAMKLVEVDHVLSVAGIAEMLTETIGTMAGDKGETLMQEENGHLDTAMSNTFAEQETNQRQLESTVFPCPECGGVLWQTDDPLLHFQCHVGHAYAAELLVGHQAEQLEAALWTSLRLLKEKATLSRQLANRAGASGNGSRMAEQAERDENYARIIHQLLEKLPGALEQMPTATE